MLESIINIAAAAVAAVAVMAAAAATAAAVGSVLEAAVALKYAHLIIAANTSWHMRRIFDIIDVKVSRRSRYLYVIAPHARNSSESFPQAFKRYLTLLKKQNCESETKRKRKF